MKVVLIQIVQNARMMLPWLCILASLFALHLGRRLRLAFMQWFLSRELARFETRVDQRRESLLALLPHSTDLRLSLGIDGARILYELTGRFDRIRLVLDELCHLIAEGTDRNLQQVAAVLGNGKPDEGDPRCVALRSVLVTWEIEVSAKTHLLAQLVRRANNEAAIRGVPLRILEAKRA